MNTDRNLGGMIIGIVLIVIGLLAFFGRYFVLPEMDKLWPLIVIGVGLAFFIPILLGSKSSAGLAIPGSILVTIGVILFAMNLTDSWEAWSYCWALIVAAVGAGIWIKGLTIGQPEVQQHGLNVLRTGLILFIVFGVIMEFIFAQSGEAHWGGILLWSVLLTLVGAYLLVTRLLQMRTPGGEQSHLFWPALMIGVGLAAAISDLGGMSGVPFGRLINLWPVLLIAAGIGLIFRNRSPWVELSLAVLIVAGIFVVVFAGGRLGLDSTGGWFNNVGSFDFGGSRQTLRPSGRLVTQNRPVSGVNSVDLQTDVDLTIQQGPAESLVVTGDEAILPALLTNTSFGQLTIREDPRYEIQGDARPKLVLTVKDLNALKLSSSGNVKVGPLTTTNFNIDLSSSCNVTIQAIQANAISAHLTSSGDILIQGQANSLSMMVTSSGNFEAGDLQVQNADITMTSSGDVTVWVVKALAVNLSSSGNIAYYGNPVVDQTISSSGKLISLGDK